ncbi:MAG TPA: hypothetical protein VHL11_21115 [Phototrophicaceae bacterium]|jgi:hypothetical protein|nr:hypothetical protein [Phototrophicaceae bacterium]
MFKREHLYHNRQTSRWAQFRIVAVGLILLLPIALAARYNLGMRTYTTTLVAIQIFVWTFQGIAILRILTLSVHATTRDYVYAGNSWDLIALTGVSARRVLWAKWRATLQASRGWLLALGLLRLGILPCCVVVYVMHIIVLQAAPAIFLPPASDIRFWESSPSLWLTPLAMVCFTVILAVLDLAYVALLGVVAGVIMERFSTAMLLAILVRFLPVIVLTMFAVQEGYITRSNIWVPWQWRITLVEGGTGALIRIPIPELRNYASDPILMQWVGLGLSVVAFMLSGCIVWWIGLKALRERGALPAR